MKQEFVLAALAAAVLSGCASGQLANRYGNGRPVVPPQPVMSANGPVSSSGGPVMWDGRGVYSGSP